MTEQCLPDGPVRVVNYGGGTNSTALLVEAVRRDIRIDLIVFADTGSEMPGTVEYVEQFSRWLQARGYPDVSIVRWIRRDGSFVPLHEWCERFVTLPSRAFGFSGCTSKWKQQPADKFVRAHPLVMAAHARGDRVERWIGYDADEPGRYERMQAGRAQDPLYEWVAPLVQWDMGRAECVEAITRAGLCRPGKSACWLCPSTKQHEIDQLQRDHPNLLARALAIEDAADIDRTKIAGLGGSLNWREYLKQPRMFVGRRPVEDACGCWDGGSDD